MPPKAPQATRAAALADVPTLGITASAKKHGVSQGTVSKWAKAAGVECYASESIANAAEAARALAEQRRTDVKARLWEIADKASKRELELIQAGSRLHDVVGARTRAIHDAELLAGRATSRTEQIETLDAEIARLVEQMKSRDDAHA
jgi:hypothetical protein